MKENNVERSEDIEFDLKRIFGAIWSKIWAVAVVGILGALIALGITRFFITPTYQSSAMFYVNNNALSMGDASFSISSSDITASKSLVDSYIVILNTRETLNDVIDYAGVNYSHWEVRSMLSASSVNETEIFEVVVTSPDAAEAEAIASAIAYILPNRISDIIEGSSAKIVDSAVRPGMPSSPSYSRNVFLGLLLGLLLTVCVIALREVFDVTIRAEEDVARGCPYPVLSSVPNMATEGKGGYYRAYEGKRRKKLQDRIRKEEQPLVGRKISFIASEAYKLLRTKLQFSFADEKNSRVIGVSSALAGEGKSLTSVNLAYTLAQLDKKVLLIDCDMRRPSLATKLSIKKYPGLSSCLSGQNVWNSLVQPCGLEDEQEAFSVIAAGRNPPNPIELLSSAKMAKVLKEMRKEYDYVILDLPPVAEVSDAMAVAKETDGILLVVRQDYCGYPVLSSVVKEFEFVGAKILGVVYNCTMDATGGYGKKYYKRYYRRYYRRYSGKYMTAKPQLWTASAEAAAENPKEDKDGARNG